MNNKTVIVFGGTGTVGAYTCVALKCNGYDVISCGGRHSDNGFFQGEGIEYISLDITDESSFSKLPVKDIYAVVNLSGALPARMEGYEPQHYIDVNLTGSLNIFKYCSTVNPEIVISTKSIADVSHLCGKKAPIPSDVVSGFPIDNDHSVYCITKNAAADLLVHYAYHIGFKYFILRFPNIYLYHPNPYYYLNGELKWQGYRLMIHKAIRNEPIAVWGNPKIERDIVYVKDCVQIIIDCLSNRAESGTYNVGTGKGVTMAEQVEGIIKVFGGEHYSHSITFEPSKPDSTGYIFDISKTSSQLGYIPQYDYINYLADFKSEMLLQRFAKLWGKDVTGDLELLK